MSNQHHIILGANHVLYVYSESGNLYNGYILEFPDYQQGSHIRHGKELCKIPSQPTVQDAEKWALKYLGL